MPELKVEHSSQPGSSRQRGGQPPAASVGPERQETAEQPLAPQPLVPTKFNADVGQIDRISQAERAKQEAAVFAETRERAAGIINREQSYIKLAEENRRDSGLFGSFHRTLTLSDPYQIEINNSSRVIGTTRHAQGMLNEAQNEKDPEKRAELVNQVRRLLGMREVEGKDFAVSDKPPISSGVNRVSTDQSHFKLEQESINVSRDVAITAAVTVGSFGGGAAVSLFTKGGQVAAGSIATVSTARVVGQGMVMGGVEGGLEATARAIDNVRSGQRTTSEAAWDITRDTTIGVGLGGALGGLFKVGAKQLGRFFGARNAADDGMRVNGEEIDKILNSPSIEGSRNARMREPGTAETGSLQNGAWVDPPTVGAEPALVGAAAGRGPDHLAAAVDGPSYNPGRMGGDVGEGPVMSGNRGRESTTPPAGNPGNTPNLELPGDRNPAPLQPHGPTKTPGMSKEDLVEIKGLVENKKLTREEIAGFTSDITTDQLQSLPARIRNAIEAAQVISKVKSSLGGGVNLDTLADNLEQLSGAGLKMADLERVLVQHTTAGANHLDSVAQLQAKGVSELAPLLDVTPRTTKIAERLLNDEAALARAQTPTGVSGIIRLYEVHETVTTLKAAFRLSSHHTDQLSKSLHALLKDTEVASRFDIGALSSMIQRGGLPALDSVISSGELVRDGFSKYVANSLEQIVKQNSAGIKATFTHADIARTLSLSRRGLEIHPPPLPTGRARDIGEATELAWQHSAQRSDRLAFTANDAIEYFAKKHDLPLPKGNQIKGLEQGVDLAVARNPKLDTWTDDSMFIQIKSSPEEALSFTLHEARGSSRTPLLIGTPGQIQTPRDLASVLDLLDQNLRYPHSYRVQTPASQQLAENLTQAIDSGVTRRTESPVWYRAYVLQEPAAEKHLVQKIKENLQKNP